MSLQDNLTAEVAPDSWTGVSNCWHGQRVPLFITAFLHNNQKREKKISFGFQKALASKMHAFLLGCSQALLLPGVWAALAWNSPYPAKVLGLLGCHQHWSLQKSCCCSESTAAVAEGPPLCPGRVVPPRSRPYSAPPTALQAAHWNWAGMRVCWALGSRPCPTFYCTVL